MQWWPALLENKLTERDLEGRSVFRILYGESFLDREPKEKFSYFIPTLLHITPPKHTDVYKLKSLKTNLSNFA